MAKRPQLHEVLAVEAGLQTTAKKINEETVRTFEKKDEHFVEFTRQVRYFNEADASLNTDETKVMATTVAEKLAYIVHANARAWDAYLQKGVANRGAVADLSVDGTLIAKDVPGTVLLGMETKLAEFRAVLEHIPTLQPGIDWQEDDTRKGGVYVSGSPQTTFRTKNMMKPVELSPSTKEHPAQVKAIEEAVPVAKIITTIRSGMLTPAAKSDLLERLDKLLREVKRARQRANTAEVPDAHFGREIFGYLYGTTLAA